MANVIYFDICAFIILAIFIGYMLFKRQVRDRANSLLLTIIELAAIATLGDLVSAVIENYYSANQISRTLEYIANYLYFVPHNLMFPVYTLYIYATVDIWHIFKQNKKSVVLWSALTITDIVVLALNPIFHNVFVITDTLEYFRKPMVSVFYVTGLICGIWGIGVIVKYRDMVRTDKVITLALLYPVVLLSVAIQLFFPEYLVEMMGIAIAVLFFMIVLQRHEYQIDPVTGALKYATNVERIANIFKMRKPVTIITIKLANHNNLRLYLGQSLFNKFLHMQTETLSDIAYRRNYPVDVFYFENGLFAFLSDEYDINKALPVAEAIREYLGKPMIIDEFTVLTDARICILRCPEDIDEFSSAFTLVTTFHETMGDTKDVMLYAEHRNDREFMIRNEMDEILARAINEQLFEMYYQPIYSTVEDRFVGAEALIRLNNEKFGFISPGLFIPIAESSGAIHAIGDYVLNEVCDFVARYDLEEMGLGYIEINLSASQCIEVDLVEKILHMIATKGIEADKICLEITETAANINPAIVDSNVQRLHAEGIRFALDDYGTGYSNIRRVTTLPVQQVKLDKSFVDEIDNPQMWIVIQDTIAMLREMGKEVLVEGVETEEVANRLTSIKTDLLQGCELIQGFYFCKPLPEKEFVEFIRSRI